MNATRRTVLAAGVALPMAPGRADLPGRHLVVLAWNKQAFRAAGLDPNRAPECWAAHAAFAGALHRDAALRWGTLLADAPAYQALSVQADAPAALQYWRALQDAGTVPPCVVPTAAAVRAFLDGQVGMIWLGSDRVARLRGRAAFPIGIAALPVSIRRGTVWYDGEAAPHDLAALLRGELPHAVPALSPADADRWLRRFGRPENIIPSAAGLA